MRPSLARLSLALDLTAFSVLAAYGSDAGTGLAMPAVEPLRATVDVSAVLRTVDSGEVLGGNLGLWLLPSHLASPFDRYVTERGARVLRYPGGQADSLCWETMRVATGDPLVWESWSWATTVDDYLALLSRIGGRPLVGLNFFDHTIDGQRHDALAEANRLASHLVAAGFRGAYYELGNELDWNASVDPGLYAERFIAYAETVKGVDPSARMAGPATSDFVPAWRDRFIDDLASRGKLSLLDVYSFHYYGGWFASYNTDTIDLSKPQVLGASIEDIRDRLKSAGAPHVRIAVTEYNAGIWDQVTRGRGSIEQALWLVDAVGELFRHADMANIWIDLSNVTEHALLSDSAVPAQPTTNYWAMLLAGWTLGFGQRDPAVSILDATGDLPTTRATIHAVRGSDGQLGMLLVNKGEALSAEVTLSHRQCSAPTARRVDEATTRANTGPVTMPATCTSGRLRIEMPRLSAVGVVLR
jgi:hypothetical protein